MPAGLQSVDPTVERETGWVTVQVANTTPLQVEEAAAVADPLAAMDAANLPERAQMDPPPALTYQYLRPGWQLAVRVNQFETAAVLQTTITAARFTSVLTQDGRMLTQARLQVSQQRRANAARSSCRDSRRPAVVRLRGRPSRARRTHAKGRVPAAAGAIGK